jgi:hypothetical protein
MKTYLVVVLDMPFAILSALALRLLLASSEGARFQPPSLGSRFTKDLQSEISAFQGRFSHLLLLQETFGSLNDPGQALGKLRWPQPLTRPP